MTCKLLQRTVLRPLSTIKSMRISGKLRYTKHDASKMSFFRILTHIIRTQFMSTIPCAGEINVAYKRNIKAGVLTCYALMRRSRTATRARKHDTTHCHVSFCPSFFSNAAQAIFKSYLRRRLQFKEVSAAELWALAESDPARHQIDECIASWNSWNGHHSWRCNNNN